MSSAALPPFLLDTGPLSVLCGFPIQGTPYIHIVLQYASILLPDAVASELRGSGKMARVVSPLINDGRVSTLITPSEPVVLDKAYGQRLGLGERVAIKSALLSGVSLVLDDQDAFIVACRFGLQPMVFQDFVVMLYKTCGLPREQAVEIVQVMARQFPAAYLTHTLELLG